MVSTGSTRDVARCARANVPGLSSASALATSASNGNARVCGVHRRTDARHLAGEHLVRIGVHPDLHGLSDPIHGAMRSGISLTSFSGITRTMLMTGVWPLTNSPSDTRRFSTTPSNGAVMLASATGARPASRWRPRRIDVGARRLLGVLQRGIVGGRFGRSVESASWSRFCFGMSCLLCSSVARSTACLPAPLRAGLSLTSGVCSVKVEAASPPVAPYFASARSCAARCWSRLYCSFRDRARRAAARRDAITRSARIRRTTPVSTLGGRG